MDSKTINFLVTMEKRKIKEYYDNVVRQKLDDFINGNTRVEVAWKTVLEFVHDPKNLLELGCGIGAICARMANQWPKAKVTGMDISEKSVEVAKKLFGTKKLHFVTEIPEGEKFDIILMMDVFEHIALSEREALYHSFKNILSDNGIILLMFPTPEHLDHYRAHDPAKLQPVDENVSPVDLMDFAEKLGKHLLFYKQVNVWQNRDYAHAVIGASLAETPKEPRGIKMSIKAAIKGKIVSRQEDIFTNPETRRLFVEKKCGENI